MQVCVPFEEDVFGEESFRDNVDIKDARFDLACCESF